MTDIIIDYINEVHIRVRSDPHVEQEISELFTFEIPAAKFMVRKHPHLKNWNGKIFLYSLKTKKVYYGLLDKIKTYAEENGYNIINNIPNDKIEYSDEFISEFIKELNLPHIPRDYQISGFRDCINNNRRLIVSPTGSGKSLLIYMLSKFHLDNKVLIIVPTTNLVEQLEGDFRSYGCHDEIHKIYSGKSRDTTSNIVIATWQTIINMPEGWINQFGAVLFDEAHTCKSKSLTAILGSLTVCKYRFGFTGTLQTEEVNILVLEGLFNTYNKVISSSELMDRKELAKLSINIIVLNYDETIKKAMRENDYQEEINFLIGNQNRNKFICNLVKSLNGNTLVLFQRVEDHGQLLYDSLKTNSDNVFYLHGKISGENRQSVINSIDKFDNSIIIASYGVLSTGVNIPKLDNAVFASPYKSKIKVLQSLGRTLRITDEKKTATLYDVADNLSYKGKNNYTLNHLLERVKIYNDEKFKYRIHEYTIK
ncbi:MAG: DEAD/DEAH box helicase family protein [Candidatus Levybacteria bacterium]|nr:DEAD/DEAH box helicase family protein [Candidatus Levybacteria bacterium]